MSGRRAITSLVKVLDEAGHRTKPSGEDSWMAACPACYTLNLADRDSLSIALGVGERIHLICWNDACPAADGGAVFAAFRTAIGAPFIEWERSHSVPSVSQGKDTKIPQTRIGTGIRSLPCSMNAPRNGVARAVTITASDVEILPVTWIWQGRLPLGKFVLLDGDPDEGKTAVMLDVAARITRGDVMPDGSRGDLDGPGSVLVVGDEDGIADTLTPRLRAAGADLARVTFLTEIEDAEGSRPLDLPGDLPVLEEAIERLGAVLVIADPLFGYLSGRTDAGRDHSVRRAIVPVAQVAGRLGATVWATRHLNKSGGGRAMYRGGESIAFIAAARVALIAGPDPTDEGRKVLAVTKCNIAGKAASLAYRLVPHDGSIRVSWEGEVTTSADGVIAAANPEQRAVDSEGDRFLRDALADGEWHDSREVKRDATSEGISAKQLRAARERLRVEIQQHGRKEEHGSRWRLPGMGGEHDRGLDTGGDVVPLFSRRDDPDDPNGRPSDGEGGAP